MFYSNGSYYSCLKSASAVPQELSTTGFMDKPGLGSFALPGYVPLPTSRFHTSSSAYHAVSLGCYGTTVKEEIRQSAPLPFLLLTDSYSKWSCPAGAMAASVCADYASWLGLQYFGLQADGQCFAGLDLDRATMYGPADASRCNAPCPGNSSEICGGLYHNSLYALKGNGKGLPLFPESVLLFHELVIHSSIGSGRLLWQGGCFRPDIPWLLSRFS